MSGIFVLVCPQCGRDLPITPNGDRGCADCQQTYLVRFGHVVSLRAGRPVSDPRRTVDSPTGGLSTSMLSPVES